MVRPVPIAAAGTLATILLRSGDSVCSSISDRRSWNKRALNRFVVFCVSFERPGHTALERASSVKPPRRAGNFYPCASVKSPSRKGDVRPETRRTRMTFEHRLVTAAAALAGFSPARRASRVDPIRALRYE